MYSANENLIVCNQSFSVHSCIMDLLSLTREMFASVNASDVEVRDKKDLNLDAEMPNTQACHLISHCILFFAIQANDLSRKP